MTTPKPERMTDEQIAADVMSVGRLLPEDACIPLARIADELTRARSGEEQAGRERDEALAKAERLNARLNDYRHPYDHHNPALNRAKIAEAVTGDPDAFHHVVLETARLHRDLCASGHAERDKLRAEVERLKAQIDRMRQRIQELEEYHG